ncbi:MAG: hypothetical protein IJT30_08290 [Muribaculaceae bacterium]|nr:hypothetical protein [Muribaculaceae bacterium]
MKKSLLFAGLFALGLTAMAQNPFAYNATTGEVDASALTVPVNYTLNADAERVVVDFMLNGEVKKSVELDATAITAGDHAVAVSLEGLDPATYDMAIRVKGAEVVEPVCTLMDIFWSPYGIAIDNDPMSAHFGRMLVTECQPSVNNSADYYTSTASGTGVGAGLYVYDMQLNRVANPQGTYGYAVPWTQENFNYQEWGGYNQGNFALKKVKISKDGRIFVGGLDVKNGHPICEVNPDDLSEWSPIFVGEQSKLEETGYDHNLYDADGEFVAGYSACFAVTGEGENLKLMNLSGTRGQVFTFGNYKTFEYPLGTATTWDAACAEEDECIPLSTQYTISAQSVSIDYDQNGNLWWTQYRGAPTEAQPTLKHVSKNADGEWEEDYSFVTSDDFAFNRGGGIAVSPDGSQLAISTGNQKLSIFDVTYNEFGAPEMTLNQTIATPSGNHTGIRGFNDIAWDYAGNLYACDNGWETLFCIQPARSAAAPAGMKRAEDDPLEVTTPLRADYAVEVPTVTAVSDVAAKAVASVEYVNVNGQVSNMPFEGVNVVVTKYADGTKSVTKVVK